MIFTVSCSFISGTHIGDSDVAAGSFAAAEAAVRAGWQDAGEAVTVTLTSPSGEVSTFVVEADEDEDEDA